MLMLKRAKPMMGKESLSKYKHGRGQLVISLLFADSSIPCSLLKLYGLIKKDHVLGFCLFFIKTLVGCSEIFLKEIKRLCL